MIEANEAAQAWTAVHDRLEALLGHKPDTDDVASYLHTLSSFISESERLMNAIGIALGSLIEFAAQGVGVDRAIAGETVKKINAVLVVAGADQDGGK